MKYTSRTVVSMAMLFGVCALVVAAALAVLTAVVVAASTGGVWAILAAIAVVAALVGVGMALPAALRRQRRPVQGVLITGDEEPLLWVEICIVAEGLHMWPPSELVLAPDASLVPRRTGPGWGCAQESVVCSSVRCCWPDRPNGSFVPRSPTSFSASRAPGRLRGSSTVAGRSSGGFPI